MPTGHFTQDPLDPTNLPKYPILHPQRLPPSTLAEFASGHSSHCVMPGSGATRVEVEQGLQEERPATVVMLPAGQAPHAVLLMWK